VLKRVLVANRGEIALRVLRACREMGIRTVGVYSEADRGAPYLALADEAHAIGPPPAAESYLRIDRILDVAKRAGADAVHPGYGFLAESAAFSEACAKARVKFIGPRPESMRALGNKVSSRLLAEKLGVPVVPGVSRPIGEAEAAAFAKRNGWPILLKAAGGGGGRGQRVVRSEKELGRAMREASREAEAAFGNADVFVERYLDRPRHIEIQFAADAHGAAVWLGERECSIQRRHQKLVEETPSTAVDDALRRRMGETAVALARAVGYEGAGTCEFLVDEGRGFYFLEVNARLQVEHPVTEMVTGLDLVKEQIRIASGERLSFRQEEIRPRGHAIEVRVCAEDPFANFAPSTGEVTGVRFPAGPYVRVDSDLASGSEVSVYYDSLVAKLIAWGSDRDEAIARLTRALREFKVVGVRTTVPFHLQLLADARFREGRVHTKFVEEEFRLKEAKAGHVLEAALLAAAMEFERRRQATPKYASPRPLSSWRRAFLDEGRA
jgi:acetyl-CoA carboxylase biotin carboxylase subunit